MKRFSDEQITEWRGEGGVLLENFFTEDEIAPCRADMDLLYGDRRDAAAPALNQKSGDDVGVFSKDQFRNFDDMPFDCSPAYHQNS